MLDIDTKRRIDAARDLLVGKVPDPKSQVEQITIALIYKFMDDIDAQAEQLGGQRKFFAGSFARFAWRQLLHPRLGGQDTLRLYAEALSKIPQNPNIPPLFRTLFQNAFLPHNSPETLRAFLKIIDEFQYDHSERLGDAFEYLLAILGAQGDAGQFRTPRHIIDFIVALLNPQKHETILDPACGTAGFLIAAYKHIQQANTNQQGRNLLTPEEKERLAKNLQGYDISPDMVRLSLANLYLHGFVAPQIYEYDTLTSEQRWTQRADVILANPPFMSPKGGIRPHSRFSIRSKRSEVLFVDYIAEHLTVSGRAGIIVPEGIIFQSQTAYQQLRKLLVEKHLAAVISLPAGVFQPYSGVKTSILILDNALARRRESIAFFKVENDGYDLGAQRRPIEQNDLPQIAQAVKEWQGRNADELEKETSSSSFILPKLLGQGMALIVKRSMIAASKDYNMSQERYKQTTRIQSKYPMVKLGEVCEIRKGRAITRKEVVKGSIPVIAGGQTPSTYHNVANRTGETITVSASGYAGYVGYFNKPIFASDCLTIKPKDERVLSAFVFRVMKFNQAEIYKLQVGAGQRHVYAKDLALFEIPLPPLEIQKEIVAEIENYQKVLNGAQMVVQNYRPTLPIDSSWPLIEIGKVIKTVTPPARIQARDFSDDGKYPVIDQSQNPVAGWTDDEKCLIDGSRGMVIFGDHTCAVKFIDGKFAQGADGIKIITVNEQLKPKFLYFYLLSYPIIPDGYKRHFRKLKETLMTIPPLKEQKAIITEIEAERELVDGNHQLIERFEKKIQLAIGRVWEQNI